MGKTIKDIYIYIYYIYIYIIIYIYILLYIYIYFGRRNVINTNCLSIDDPFFLLNKKDSQGVISNT